MNIHDLETGMEIRYHAKPGEKNDWELWRAEIVELNPLRVRIMIDAMGNKSNAVNEIALSDFDYSETRGHYSVVPHSEVESSGLKSFSEYMKLLDKK